jgi:hypothetical protein
MFFCAGTCYRFLDSLPSVPVRWTLFYAMNHPLALNCLGDRHRLPCAAPAIPQDVQ